MWVALSGCQTLSRQGPVPKAVAHCRQLSQQGISAREHGDWEQAESLLNQAVGACPVDTEARRQYAETLWHRGAVQKAIEQLEEARRIAGDDTALAVRVGEMYLASRQFDAARRVADQALDWDPKCAAAWALRGKTLEATGQVRRALADYQRSLGYAPGCSDVLLHLAESYRQAGEPQSALAALQNLIDTYPRGEEPPNVLYLQALALTNIGRYEESIEALSLAARRGGPHAELFSRIAEAELLAGHPERAQAALQQALALDPGHAMSRALRDRLHPAHVAVEQPLRR